MNRPSPRRLYRLRQFTIATALVLASSFRAVTTEKNVLTITLGASGVNFPGAASALSTHQAEIGATVDSADELAITDLLSVSDSNDEPLPGYLGGIPASCTYVLATCTRYKGTSGNFAGFNSIFESLTRTCAELDSVVAAVTEPGSHQNDCRMSRLANRAMRRRTERVTRTV